MYLVLYGVLLLLHLGQSELQVIDVLLQLGALVLQLPLLGGQLSAHLLLVLQPLGQLLQLGLHLDLALDQALAALLRVQQVVPLLA